MKEIITLSKLKMQKMHTNYIDIHNQKLKRNNVCEYPNSLIPLMQITT